MLEAFAFQFPPATCNVQSADNFFTTCLSGINSILECFKRRSISAIPGEKQTIGPRFDSRFGTSRINIGKFDNERRSSWFDQRLIFTYKTNAAAALGAACLCEHVMQFSHLKLFLLIGSLDIMRGRGKGCFSSQYYSVFSARLVCNGIPYGYHFKSIIALFGILQ